GAMIPLAEEAADALEGDASVEILDVRTLKPLDEEALLAAAAKTGRVVIIQEAPRVCGFAAELAAMLAEKAILDLQARVLRVTGQHRRDEGSLEIGYWVRSHLAGRGFATEAAAALTRVAFELCGTERVDIRCDPDNAASRAIPRKLGYTEDGTLRRRLHGPEG